MFAQLTGNHSPSSEMQYSVPSSIKELENRCVLPTRPVPPTVLHVLPTASSMAATALTAASSSERRAEAVRTGALPKSVLPGDSCAHSTQDIMLQYFVSAVVVAKLT